MTWNGPNEQEDPADRGREEAPLAFSAESKDEEEGDEGEAASGDISH